MSLENFVWNVELDPTNLDLVTRHVVHVDP